MKYTGIVISALVTAAFIFLGKTRNPDFYLAAVFSGLLLFRLATGSSCPLVWLLTRLGVGGLSCPTDLKKSS